MRVLSFVVSSALLIAGGSSVAFAQRSGGHMSSGHVSSAGVHSHATPATTYSTLSNHYPATGQLVYPTPLGLQHQYSGYTGINPGVLPSGNYNRRGYRGGYGYGAGFLYPPYYLSTFDDSDTPYVYNNSWAQDPGTQNAQVTANLLGEQVAQLSAEVEALRNERAAPAGVPSYAPPMRPPYNAPPDDTPASTPVTLVMHSGKQVKLNSYAVMGNDIWDFSGPVAKRIPLSTIDLNASKTATEANGGEFPEIR